MDVGIVGRPAVGRSTVFRALLAQRAPRASGERHAQGAVGSIQVADPRLARLSELFKPKKTTPIEVRVTDLCPSLEPSFPTDEIEAMKRCDTLLLVIPAFLDPSPEAAAGELERLAGELCLEDLAAVERRLERASRERLDETARTALEAAREALEAERPVSTAQLGDAARAALRGYSLVTDRPLIAVLNTAEDAAGKDVPQAVRERAAQLELPVLTLCAELEAEMAELPQADRGPFLAEYGVREAAGAAVTRALLERSSLIPFFTVGEDECRAWPVPAGCPARQAAGKIHSDIERGFIRAEVISYEELEALSGDLTRARKAGKLRLEGKDYAVQDGDVINFRFNV